MRWLVWVLAAACWSAVAWADPLPAVRVGDHPGFGRIVYEFPDQLAYTASEQSGQLVVTFVGAQTVPDAPRMPRNVVAATGGEGMAVIRMAPGARWRAQQMGSRIVVDILDPARPSPPHARATVPVRPVMMLAPPAPAPAPEPEPAVNPEHPAAAPVLPVAREVLPAPSEAPTAAPQLAAPSPVQLTPVAPAAAPTEPRVEPGGIAAVLADRTVAFPFPRGTGAAAYGENGNTVLVFDERRPLDLSPLRGDAVWGSAVIQLLPEATLVRLAQPASGLSLRPSETGWSVTAAAPGEAPPVAPPLDAQLTDAGLVLPGHTPGRVVVVPAPGGRRTLIGTWREAEGSVAARRRMPEFSLLPTLLGVAVDPVSDRIGLSARNDGFIVTAQGLPLAASAVERTAPGGRLFDLPSGTPAELIDRLQSQIAAAARGGPLSRTAGRLAAAQTMLALGLGPEAQSLLRAAAATDPEAASGDLMLALGAASAVLTGRPDEAAALDDPRFAGNGEALLWRGVRDSMRDPASTSAALVFASAGPLVASYPDNLRRRLRPRMAETMALGGQGVAADALVTEAGPGDPSFALARAVRTGAEGDVDGALTGFDAVIAGHDLRQRARAMVLRTDFALAAGRLDPLAAADAMDRAAAAWRNGPAERDARLRASAIRTGAGAWRPALEGLQDATTLFPDDRPAIRDRMAGVFTAMLDATPPVAPLDLVTLAGEFPDILPEGEKGAVLADRLADALTALDLPGRAGPVLKQMIERASGPARAALGRRLAAVRLDDADPAGALAALAASDVPDQSPALTEARGLLRARAQAASDLGAATAGLSALGTRAADDLRAQLLASAGDWSGARVALADLLAKTPLAEAPPVVLRLATAVARLDDPASRRQLRDQWAGKLPPGRDADLFRLLTAEPIRAPSDLPRAAGEIALARSIPR